MVTTRVTTMEIGVKQAKINLSKLIYRVHNGEQILITNNGEVIAELKAVRRPKDPTRGFGIWKDRFPVPVEPATPDEEAQVLALFDWSKKA